MLSISVTIGLLGAIYGGAPVSYMQDVFGYTSVIKGFCVLGLVLASITYWLVPDTKCEVESTVWADIKEVLGNRYVLVSCLSAGLMVGPLEGFADVWGSSFLKSVYGFEGAEAASLPSMIFIGMCFGAPVLSLIAEKIQSELVAVIGAGIFMCLSFCMLLAFQMSFEALVVLFVGVGVASSYQILAIYKASTYVPKEVSGLTTAIANMIIMTFGYLFHAVIGVSVDLVGYTFGIGVIPVALFVGVMGFIAMRTKENNYAISK